MRTGREPRHGFAVVGAHSGGVGLEYLGLCLHWTQIKESKQLSPNSYVFGTGFPLPLTGPE